MTSEQARHALASIKILGLHVTKIDSPRGESIGSRRQNPHSQGSHKWLDGLVGIKF